MVRRDAGSAGYALILLRCAAGTQMFLKHWVREAPVTRKVIGISERKAITERIV